MKRGRRIHRGSCDLKHEHNSWCCEDAEVFNLTEFALFVTYLIMLMSSITMMEMDMLRLWPPTVGVMVSVCCTLKRESLSVHCI